MRPKEFADQCKLEIDSQGQDAALIRAARELHKALGAHNYFHHFIFAGLPIIQAPQDILQMQEIIWALKPDLIIETGVARGGSLMLYSSCLELNASLGGPKDASVIGIDIDIRPHNRAAIEAHPLSKRITLIQGSSVSPAIAEQVRHLAAGKKQVLVCLDSNHTHEHVLAELRAYAPLTSIDSYCVVFDTIVEELPSDLYQDRPWGPGNNPKTAVREYLSSHPEFVVDRQIDHKLVITGAPEGYLRRIA